jgi:hypothetical protein
MTTTPGLLLTLMSRLDTRGAGARGERALLEQPRGGAPTARRRRRLLDL